MKKVIKLLGKLTALCAISATLFACQSKSEEIKLRILHSSDIHGHVFPYDFLKAKADLGSMARLATIVKQARQSEEALLLLDGGDILQGDPSAYYYSFIDSSGMHLITQAMNYLRYDAAAPGNHDIEAGHAVYDKWARQCEFPILAANVKDKTTGKNYWQPYQVFEKEGLRIAVIGFLTPAIPQWLPEQLWEGLEFEDIIESAKKYIPEIQKKEKPDLLIALMHSGLINNNANYLENAGQELARTVPGIDIMLLGHDHREQLGYEVNPQGDSVLIADPASKLNLLSDITVTFTRKGKKVVNKSIEAKLCNVDEFEPDADFEQHFAESKEAVKNFVDEKIGSLSQDLIAWESLFGASDMLSVVHKLQLEISKADISFAAPLSVSAEVKAGDIRVRDLFAIYPFENFLYTLSLSGKEIKDYLEYSYSLWCNTMQSPADPFLLMRPDAKETDRFPTLHPTFNYSTAAGIDYEVDLRKPLGERVRILGMSNGKPFDLEQEYSVAMNSYRANGGGGHLSEGAGISSTELKKRIKSSTDKDLRLYMINFVREKGSLDVQKKANWHFVPSAWVEEAAKRERAIFIPKKK